MANEIQELLNEIRDERLRKRLSTAIGELRKTKNFGLVFEEHLPELLPIYNAKIRSHTRVARKNGPLTETFIVERVVKGIATVMHEQGDGEPQCIPVAELVMVKRFGEAIFPALRHVKSVLRGGDAPHHILIEADNYHALQLLEWLYAGKMDCIYIDPPYNTGARDWKYNNSYVDKNDSYRHSKWLSMIKKRLAIAERLLKPDGVICITIDDYEVHHLLCLVEQTLRSLQILGVLVIKTSPSGRPSTAGMRVAHEYALFVGGPLAKVGRFGISEGQRRFFSEEDKDGPFAWQNLRKRGGANTMHKARPRQFYPLFVSKRSVRIPRMTWDKSKKFWSVHDKPKQHETELLPIGDDGRERIWSLGAEKLASELHSIQVRYEEKENQLSVWRKIRPNKEGSLPSTWWDSPRNYIVENGAKLLGEILGRDRPFPFPKSPYAVADCLRVAGAAKKDALILDFFAGSGTTFQAVTSLNEEDDGQRRCIIVTNNEVAEEESRTLAAEGLQPGSVEWEVKGICQSITWPRCKFVINGHRDDGTKLSGEYLTGQFAEQEVRRAIRSLDFTSVEAFSSRRAREALALAVGFAMSKINGKERFLLSEDDPVAVLLDPNCLDDFIEQGGEKAETIKTVYLPFTAGKAFNDARAKLTEAGRR
jgi:adenine-specific DNA-methyltransferase